MPAGKHESKEQLKRYNDALCYNEAHCLTQQWETRAGFAWWSRLAGSSLCCVTRTIKKKP